MCVSHIATLTLPSTPFPLFPFPLLSSVSCLLSSALSLLPLPLCSFAPCLYKNSLDTQPCMMYNVHLTTWRISKRSGDPPALQVRRGGAEYTSNKYRRSPPTGRNRIMILHSQPLSEFVLIRANSWLIHSPWPETPNLPIQPSLPKNYDVIMQNKPNFLKAKTNATLFTTKNYEQKPPLPTRKNKPKTNSQTRPWRANFSPWGQTRRFIPWGRARAASPPS